jgi:hypothetical protein
VKREEILLQKINRFGWFPILLELKKMFFKGNTMLFLLDRLEKNVMSISIRVDSRITKQSRLSKLKLMRSLN